jgi:hypothetical protein
MQVMTGCCSIKVNAQLLLHPKGAEYFDCLTHFYLSSEKLIPSIPACDYSVVAIGHQKSFAKSESDTNLVMFDVY